MDLIYGKENKDFLKRVMAGMRRRMDANQSSEKWRMKETEYNVFEINIEIKISFFNFYFLLDGFEYVYLKFDSEFYLLANHAFHTFNLTFQQSYVFGNQFIFISLTFI